MAFVIGDSVAHKSNPTVLFIVTEVPNGVEGFPQTYTVNRFCKDKGVCTPIHCLEEELMAYVAP